MLSGKYHVSLNVNFLGKMPVRPFSNVYHQLDSLDKSSILLPLGFFPLSLSHVPLNMIRCHLWHLSACWLVCGQPNLDLWFLEVCPLLRSRQEMFQDKSFVCCLLCPDKSRACPTLRGSDCNQQTPEAVQAASTSIATRGQCVLVCYCIGHRFK